MGPTTNVVVVFTKCTDLRRTAERLLPQVKLTDPKACYGLTFQPHGRPTSNEIAGVLVAVATDVSLPFAKYCISGRVAQLLGLFGSSELIRPSVFSRNKVLLGGSATSFSFFASSPTDDDKVLIRAHYDPRLKIGMDRNDALPIARTIIEEIVKGGETSAIKPPSRIRTSTDTADVATTESTQIERSLIERPHYEGETRPFKIPVQLRYREVPSFRSKAAMRITLPNGQVSTNEWTVKGSLLPLGDKLVASLTFQGRRNNGSSRPNR